MGMLRDFHIKEVDQKENPMNIKTFYTEHVSKSLPVVFRNEWADEMMVKGIA